MKISKKRLVEIIQEECAMAHDVHVDHEIDHEGEMAKRQLYNMEKYASELSAMLSDTTQLESWVQAKLTKAADYLKTVKHYVEYGMEEGAYDQVSSEIDPIEPVGEPMGQNINVDDEEMIKIMEE
tara:strand:- start:46 stop:420 length:375 start_codon:yes stop_codon:yes gene_type:complete